MMGTHFYPWHVRWRRRLRSLLWTGVLAALLALLWWTNRPPPLDGRMIFASDGDSFSITVNSQPQRLRLTGIDAPELGQSCRDTRKMAWPCGRDARDALGAIAPRGALLACTSSGQDEYRRALSRCRLPDGRDVAALLVEQGWAVATNEDYLLEQDAARRARIGLWRGDFDMPADWRAAHPRSNAAMLPPA
jgi:endonuclease YncB( thermonuclease family)